MTHLAAAFLLGLISACGFAPLDLWPLTLIGLAGLMWLVQRAASLRGALGTGWWFGLGHFTMGLNWIATAFSYQDAMPHWLGWIAVALLALYLAVYPAMAAGLAWRWGRSDPSRLDHPRHAELVSASTDQQAPPEQMAEWTLKQVQGDGLSSSKRERVLPFILIFAAAWIVTEWLRATMFTGFAWNPLGAALVGTYLDLQSATIGTFGLSGLLVLLAGIGLLVAQLHLKSAAGLAIAFTPLILWTEFQSFGNLPSPGEEPRPGALIRVVQPNIGQQDKWREGFEDRNFARLAKLTGAPISEPRLILWPEAAVPEYLEEERPKDRRARARIMRLLGPRDILLTGGVAIEWGKDGYAVAARNSLFGLDGRGRILGRYDKAHLVPYGEYLPMRPILSAIGLSRLAPGDLDFWPGPGPATLSLPGFGKVGVQICYEIIFSGHVVDAKNRPDFIFNPSNDAWFGSWGPPQHLAQARLRAIEEGLPVIRSTPTGISAVIDADGRLLADLPWRRAGFIDARLPPPRPPTLFARYGNLLPFLFAALLIAVAIACRRRGR